MALNNYKLSQTSVYKNLSRKIEHLFTYGNLFPTSVSETVENFNMSTL